jgi:hypothetical protein
MKTTRVIYMGAEVDMPAARAAALVEAGQAQPVPETAAARAPRNAARPRAKTRTATRKPKGGKKP